MYIPGAEKQVNRIRNSLHLINRYTKEIDDACVKMQQLTGKDTPNAEQYEKVARAKYESDDLEIDDKPSFSPGDGGCWVSAWVWVYDQDLRED
jgi:hypothetical protein